ncbi:hypothetical protein E4099_20015 [Streptomyces palmae]|uniref:Transferase n=1 Tax=Streptomyces palmae TaxID=1701085 RepID=A0A4Z0H065_9ACTN|nr:hypothetical protein E4099_20015 [Streptomyces palmae]
MTVPPRAHCVADPAGTLTFDVFDWRPAGAGAGLLLTPRGPEGAADTLRLPLAPIAGERLRAVLTVETPLPEGRWDVYVAEDGAQPRRLSPGNHDLRALVDREPPSGAGPLAVRIPYATKYGNLSVRSWVRAPHVEAGDIRVGAEELTVHGRLAGAEHPADLLAGAVLEARPRGAEPGTGPTAKPTTEGAAFSCALRYADLVRDWAGERLLLDLWLRPADGAPVRLARILDDVPDKKEIFVYPAREVAAPHGAARVVAYYTVDNDLSVRVERAG